MSQKPSDIKQTENLDLAVIEKIAKLARLKLTESEAQEHSTQLAKVLNYFEEIAQIDTQGVEPLVTPVAIQAFWREDKQQEELSAEEILANAPDRVGNLFKVPPVV